MARRKYVPKHYPFFLMIKEVLVEAIYAGYTPLALLALVICMMLILMPGEDIKPLIQETKISDYLFSLFIALAWSFHVQRIRKNHKDEMDRATNEKTDLQIQLSKAKLTSSKE